MGTSRLLNVGNLTVHYGKALAVNKVCFEVQEGKIAIIVGLAMIAMGAYWRWG